MTRCLCRADETMRLSSGQRLIGLSAVWLLGVSFGLSRLGVYESTAGSPAQPPATWPTASILPRTPGQPTLLLFLHPRCPCSRASVAELEQIVAKADSRPDIYALFCAPDGAPPDWLDTDLRDRVASIPGVRALRD